eukprot:13367882-Alexandrium_andersonii.AAC.1
MDLDDGEKEIPMLISNSVQRELQLSMRLTTSGADEVCFHAWGEDWYPLLATRSGNPASSLLDFSSDGHPGLDRVDECYT